MILVDANIFMYAAGEDSPQKDPCQKFLLRIAQQNEGHRKTYVTNAEVMQEILHRYRKIKRPELGYQIFDLTLNAGIHVLPVTERDMIAARFIAEEHSSLSTRDAVHLGVMQGNSIDTIYTYDRDFDQVDWVKRKEP